MKTTYLILMFLFMTLLGSFAQEISEEDRAILDEIITGCQKNRDFFKTGRLKISNHTIYRGGPTAKKKIEVTFSGGMVRSIYDVKQYEGIFDVSDTIHVSPKHQYQNDKICDGVLYLSTGNDYLVVNIHDQSLLQSETTHHFFRPFERDLKLDQRPLKIFLP